MFEVTREIRFCYGHRLLHHAGKCRHLHGHNARARVTVTAKELDDLGMVVDFGEIKSKLGAWINEQLDHRLLLQRDDPLVSVLRQNGEPVFVMEDNPTAENIARLIFQRARSVGLAVTRVELWETEECFAAYRADGAES